MRLLFEMDKHDYAQCARTQVRPSARSIILAGGKAAMIHSLWYDFYKFPGGGIEAGESPVEAMIRETREEAGLVVLPESVREYGLVHRVEKSGWDENECFLQDNYYYLCEAAPETVAQILDAYEANEGYRLEYVTPALAIRKNRTAAAESRHAAMLEREARILEMLMAEGLL